MGGHKRLAIHFESQAFFLAIGKFKQLVSGESFLLDLHMDVC